MVAAIVLGACAVDPPPTAQVPHLPPATADVSHQPVDEPGANDAMAALDSASAVTVIIAVPPPPAHLTQTQRPLLDDHDRGEHDDHGHDDGPVSEDDVAAAWVAAVYTARYDDPDTSPLAEGLAVDPALVTNARGALPGLDVEALEVRWPVVTAIADDGGGWWQVSFVLKYTRADHVGPATTGPLTARVHVTDGLVDGWEPPA